MALLIPHLWNREKECHIRNQTEKELLALETALEGPERKSLSETSGPDADHRRWLHQILDTRELRDGERVP